MVPRKDSWFLVVGQGSPPRDASPQHPASFLQRGKSGPSTYQMLGCPWMPDWEEHLWEKSDPEDQVANIWGPSLAWC